MRNRTWPGPCDPGYRRFRSICCGPAGPPHIWSRTPQWRELLFILVLSSCILALPACEEEPVVEPRSVYTVTYSLNISGESTEDYVTYFFSGRTATATNPTDGWSIEVEAGDGATVSASAEGAVKNGHIILYMSVDPTTGNAIERQDECNESAGLPTLCDLSTGDVKLQ